jgi:hypothetical protein
VETHTTVEVVRLLSGWIGEAVGALNVVRLRQIKTVVIVMLSDIHKKKKLRIPKDTMVILICMHLKLGLYRMNHRFESPAKA